MAKVIKSAVIAAAAVFVTIAIIASGGTMAPLFTSGALAFGGSTAAFAIAAQYAVVTLVGAVVAGGIGMLTSRGINASRQNFGTKIAGRGAQVPRQIVYGECRVGGTIVKMHTSGTKNNKLHLAVVLAGHEIESLVGVYLNDNLLTTTTTTVGGETVYRVTNAKYKNTDNEHEIDTNGTLIQYTFHDGSQTTVDGLASTNASSRYPSTAKFQGMAYVYMEIIYDPEKMPGMPPLSFRVKGKKVYDPRTSTTAYSNNPALIIRDYLTDTTYGLRALSSEINDTTAGGGFAAAANACEVDVTLADNSSTEARFTLNGFVNAASAGDGILEGFISSCGGKLTHTNGKFNLFVATAQTPTLSINDDDILDTQQLSTKSGNGDLFNGIKALYVDKEQNYQGAESPLLVDSTYLAEDTPSGEQSANYKKILETQLPFTVTHTMAQRLQKIQLKRHRESATLSLLTTLEFMKLQPGDWVNVTNDRLNYSAKSFEVLSTQMEFAENEGVVYAATRLTLQEVSAGIYDYVYSEYSTPQTAGSTPPGGDLSVGTPTTVSLAQRTRPEGPTAKIDIIVTWTNAAETAVQGTEIQYKESGESDYDVATIAGRGATSAVIQNVQVGKTYDVRIRHFSWDNVYGAFVDYSQLTITEPDVLLAPGNPSATTDKPFFIELTWTNPTNANFRAVEVHYSTTSGFTPDSNTLLNTYYGEPGKQKKVILGVSAGLAYDTNYYFKLRSVNVYGTTSGYTNQAQGVFKKAQNADVENLNASAITAGTIDASTITVENIDAGNINAGTLDSSRVNAGEIVVGGLESGVTIDAGSLTMSAGGHIKGGQVEYNDADASGFFLGYDTDAYKFSIGNADNSQRLTFDGSNLSVKGTLTVGSTDLTEANTLNSNTNATDVAGLPQASFTSIGSSAYSPAVNGSRVTWTENGTAADWATKLVSDQSFSGGAFITFVVNKDNATNSRYMVGLANVATGNSYTVIDYAIFVRGTANDIIAYESGTNAQELQGSLTAGDVCTVLYDGNKVQYIINGTVEREVNLTSPLTGQVYAHISIDDGSTHDVEHRIDGLQFGPVTSVVENLVDGVQITGGGITMSSGGAIKGGQTAFATGDGYFLGYDTDDYKFSVGDSSNYIQWNGSALSVKGTITVGSTDLTEANTLNSNTSASDVGLGNVDNLDAQGQAQSGLITGTTITGGGIVFNEGGALNTTGKTSESNTTNGFFLGYNGTNYTFGVGDATHSMIWDGTDLTVTGDIVSDNVTLSSGGTLTDPDGIAANVAINLAFPVDGLTYYWPCNSIADTDGDGDEELQETVSGKTGIHSGTAPTLSTDSPSGNAVVNASGSGWTLLNDTDADALEGANGFAWSIWFKSETTTGDSQARIIGRDASDGWALIIDQDGTSQGLVLYGEPGTESMGTVASGEWHHFCLSEDGNGTISGYLDGELVSTEAYTPVVSSRPVVMGCNTESSINTAASVFIGKLTEVRAYNRALTAIEVRALYKVPTGGIPQKIDGDLIVDGTITTDQLAADSVTASEINVTNLAAISADLGAITAGSVNIGSGAFTVSTAGLMTATGATITGGEVSNTTTVGGTAASTVASGAAAGATASQVNKGLALLLNEDANGSTNNGEGGLVGVDKDGVPDPGTNGFIIYKGNKITVERDQYSSNFTILTHVANKRGFICFDANKTEPFTMTTYGDLDVAFVWKEGDQWYYDENDSTGVSFAPSTITGTQNGTDGTTTPDLVAIGWLETSTTDLILTGGLFEPIALESAPFAGDVYNSGTIGGISIDADKIYKGNGAYGATNTDFYLGDDGRFSLRDKLKFDATADVPTLEVTGLVTATRVTVGTGATTAAMSADGPVRFWAGSENPSSTTPFVVESDGEVFARNLVLTDADGNEYFNAQDGFTALALSTIAGSSSGVKVTTYSEAFSSGTGADQGDNGEIEIAFEQTSNVTFSAKISGGFRAYDTDSTASAAQSGAIDRIPDNVTVMLRRHTSSGFTSSQGTLIGTTTFTKTTNASPTSTQYQAVAVTDFFDPELEEYFAAASITRGAGAVGATGQLTASFTVSSLASGTYYIKAFVSTSDTNYDSTFNKVTSSTARTIEILDNTTDGGFTVDGGASQSVGAADITGVTAGTNLTGGGLSGSVTLGLASTISGDHTFSDNLTVSGDLTVSGTTTTLNTATLDVQDKNITLNYGSGDTSGSADGAGITIQDAVNSSTDATILWDATNDEFDFSHPVSVSGNLTATGNIRATGSTAYLEGKSLILDNGEVGDADFANAYQMIVDANDSDSDVPGHGNHASSYPFGVYFLGDNGGTTKTLGAGLVKLWHTGHFTKAHIDHFVGLYSGTQNLTVPDLTADQISLEPSSGSGTGGGRLLDVRYSGTDRLITLSADRSSGALTIGYGAESSTATSQEFLSTFDNFSGKRSAVQFRADRIDVWGTSANVQTAEGSQLTTMTNRISLHTDNGDIEAAGTIYDGSGNSGNWNTAYGWGDHASAGYLTSSSLTFDGLSGKTSGTGDYSTTGDIVAGRGSGSIALTINDGKGNSNLTFNHQNGVPDQNGNAARIEVNTDSSTGASMYFEVKSGVTGGTGVDLTPIFRANETGLYMESGKVIYGSAGVTIQANDTDFVVQDTTGATTNFIWRDHSAGKLYFGASDALPEFRTNATFQAGNTLSWVGASGTFALNVYHATTNVVARFESGDTEVWIDLHDSDSGTYGALLGHTSTELFKVADQGVNVRMSLNNSGLLDTDAGYSVGGNTVITSGRALDNITGLDLDTSTSNSIDIVATDSTANASFTTMKIDHNASGSDTLTADRSHVGLFIDMDSTATGGDTSNEHRLYGIQVDVRATGDSDLMHAGYFYSESQHSAGQVTDNVGVYGFAVADDTGTGHTANNIGGRFYAYGYNSGTGGTTNHYAVFAKTLLTSAADKNTNSATGVYAEVEVDTSGTTTTLSNAYVFQAQFDNDSSDTTISNGYLYYGKYAGTLPNNAYGVYIADSVRNYFGGHLTTGLGSVSVPSYSFNGDTNTGMYSPANHQLGFAVNGSRKMYMSTTTAFFQNLTGGVQVPSLSIGSTEAITASREASFATRVAVGGIDSTGNNAPPSSNAVLSGYGLIGNRGTFYITNGGGTIQIGNGSVHNSDPTCSFTTAAVDLASGVALTFNGTTRIASNGNATFGTISSGAITSTGTSTLNNFRLSDTSRLGFGTVKAGATVGHNATVDEGIFWHTNNEYGIYRTSGSWTSPNYPYLKLAFATGIKLDGGTAGQYGNSGVDIIGSSDLQMGGTTVIDASRNLYGNYSVLGRSIRSTNRGELHLNATGAADVSEIFFGYGDGFAGNDSQIRWGISDRGTTTGTLNFYKGPANNSGAFQVVANFSAGSTRFNVVGGYEVNGTTRIDSAGNGIFPNAYVSGYIYHNGDTNTYIRFVAADDLQLVAGGRQMLRMDEGTDPDLLQFVVSTTYTDSSGNIVASGNVTAYASDKRLKTNIKPIENALEKIKAIRGVTYDWKDEVEELGFIPDRKTDCMGVIAQELEEAGIEQVIKPAPFDQHRSAETDWKFVSKSGEDYKTVDYDKLTALCIQGIKEQQEIIDRQQAQIDQLMKALKEIKNGDNQD